MTKTVTRYSYAADNHDDVVNSALYADQEGQWVRYEDIQHLLVAELPAKPSPYRVEIRCGKCNALIPHDPRVVLREIVCPNGCGALGTKP